MEILIYRPLTEESEQLIKFIQKAWKINLPFKHSYK